MDNSTPHTKYEPWFTLISALKQKNTKILSEKKSTEENIKNIAFSTNLSKEFEKLTDSYASIHSNIGVS